MYAYSLNYVLAYFLTLYQFSSTLSTLISLTHSASHTLSLCLSLSFTLTLSMHPLSLLHSPSLSLPACTLSPSLTQGKLLTDPGVAESGSHNKPYHSDPTGKFGPMVLHNVGYGTQTTDGNSITNRDEVSFYTVFVLLVIVIICSFLLYSSISFPILNL